MIEQLVWDEQCVFNDSQTLNHFVRIFIIVFRQLLHDTLSLTSQSKSVMVNNELMMFLNGLHKQTKINSLNTVEDFVLISELLSQQKYDSLGYFAISPKQRDTVFHLELYPDWTTDSEGADLQIGDWSGTCEVIKVFNSNNPNDPSYPWTLAV